MVVGAHRVRTAGPANREADFDGLAGRADDPSTRRTDPARRGGGRPRTRCRRCGPSTSSTNSTTATKPGCRATWPARSATSRCAALLPDACSTATGASAPPLDLDTLVIENDRLRATVLPGLGGRIHSLFHKPTGRELLYRNPVFQPADFALNGAWFSGGIEWNIGATGHTTLSCAPLHAARVPRPTAARCCACGSGSGCATCRSRSTCGCPTDSDFLHVGVRIRNPHERPAPVYWWSNIAVPEETPRPRPRRRGLALRLRAQPAPRPGPGVRRRGPHLPACSGEYPADYFYEVPDGQRRWITALDADGHGLVQTSTDLLRGRKLFLWGHGARRPALAGVADRAGHAAATPRSRPGLARTQLEHVRLDAEGEFSWLEAYGPLSAATRRRARRGLGGRARRGRGAGSKPRCRGRTSTPPTRPGARTPTPNRRRCSPPARAGARSKCCAATSSCPAPPSTSRPSARRRQPWLDLLRTGSIPEPRRVGPPGPTLVAPHWRDMLETAPAAAAHRVPPRRRPVARGRPGPGRTQLGARPRTRAVPAGRCCAAWPSPTRRPVTRNAPPTATPRPSTTCARSGATTARRGRRPPAALGREAIDALLAARRPGPARAVWDRLHAATSAPAAASGSSRPDS